MAENQINVEMDISEKAAPLLKQNKIFTRILPWIFIFAVVAGVFFYLKKETNYYLSTMPQSVSSKKHSDAGAFPVRGLHITSSVAGSPKMLKPLIELVNKTELNAMVIDLKESDGKIAYNSKLAIVDKIGTKLVIIRDLDELLATLKENNIFPIARICVFKDPLLAQKLPHLAVRDKNGSIWRDKKGLSWVDPYCKQVWEYNAELAEEAAQRGFKEIQFDYTRFPSDGIISNCVYTYKNSQGDSASAMAVKGFLKYVAVRLKPYGVAVSVDVFGLTCSITGDMNIGQVIEKIGPEVDCICPMVYPSHYYHGMYNLKDPESSPYQTVSTSLRDAQRRVGKICRVRPWLQDFSLRVKYSADDVREQIRACYENGIQEWLLWNPSCRYTAQALKPKSERNVLAKTVPIETNVQSETLPAGKL
jgi:hypothetical protein